MNAAMENQLVYEWDEVVWCSAWDRNWSDSLKEISWDKEQLRWEQTSFKKWDFILIIERLNYAPKAVCKIFKNKSQRAIRATGWPSVIEMRETLKYNTLTILLCLIIITLSVLLFIWLS